jgi:hypothetical protein
VCQQELELHYAVLHMCDMQAARYIAAAMLLIKPSIASMFVIGSAQLVKLLQSGDQHALHCWAFRTSVWLQT